jgi:hypothetical protein
MKKRMLCFVLSCVMSVGALFGCANSEQAPSKPSVAATVETELETEKETVAESDDMTESSNTSDNHKHSYTQKITKEPTCDEKGIITYTCTCGDSYTEETSYLDHCTDRSEITKKATCEEEGIETFYCIFCGKEIYTEKIAKLPHTENCKHALKETVKDPKNFTFTQCIKIMYVTDTAGLYAWPDVNSNPYRELEIGTAIPVISKCDQANFYRTPSGMTVSGWNLSEVRPTEYDAGEEKGWENFKEETDSKYTYWTGVYRMNGYELHCEHMNKPYVERHLEYARQGLYTLMYRDVDSKHWSGCYEIMIEENGEFYTSEYRDWIVAYMESKGLKISVQSEEPLLVYRSPKDENSKKLRVISVSVGK